MMSAIEDGTAAQMKNTCEAIGLKAPPKRVRTPHAMAGQRMSLLKDVARMKRSGFLSLLL